MKKSGTISVIPIIVLPSEDIRKYALWKGFLGL
jgi:hypothetical protein